MSIFKEAHTLQKKADTHQQIFIRQPTPDDGIAVYNLIRRSAFLDNNSLYCYLVLCSHFHQTSVVASLGNNTNNDPGSDLGNDLVGAVTAYIPPQQPDTLFVWQIAVDAAAQGRGLGRNMLDHLLSRAAMRDINYVETTVTADNQASRALFSSLARRFQAGITESVMFDRSRHFRNLHDTEHKLHIGPLQR